MATSNDPRNSEPPNDEPLHRKFRKTSRRMVRCKAENLISVRRSAKMVKRGTGLMGHGFDSRPQKCTFPPPQSAGSWGWAGARPRDRRDWRCVPSQGVRDYVGSE